MDESAEIKRVEEAVRALGWFPDLCRSGSSLDDGWRSVWTLRMCLPSQLPFEEPRNEGEHEYLFDSAEQYMRFEASDAFHYTDRNDLNSVKGDEERHAARLASSLLLMLNDAIDGGKPARARQRAEMALAEVLRKIETQQRELRRLEAHRDALRDQLAVPSEPT